MSRHVLVACSSRKISTEFIQHWEPSFSIDDWLEICKNSPNSSSPGDLYIGRNFKKQRDLVYKEGDHLWIVSAGLGLLDGSKNSKDEIFSYQASFTKEYGAKTNLWSRLKFGGLSRILDTEGEIIVLLPKLYQEAIMKDPVFSEISDRMIVLGGGPLRSISARSTPYHQRMVEVYGGERLGLFTNLLRAFYDDPVDFTILESHYQEAVSLPPPQIKQKIDGDNELSKIISELPESISSGSKAVRYIRDVLNRSCSQERITKAWKAHKEKLSTRESQIHPSNMTLDDY